MRERILKEWRKILVSNEEVSVEEFNKIRDEVIKILEEDLNLIKKFLNELGVEYKSYIEVDGGDVYLVLKVKNYEIYYDGEYGEIYKNDGEVYKVGDFKGVEELLEFLKNLK